MGIFLDLSKAFNTLNHKILLAKLHQFGIRGNVLNWFESYLMHRKQYTSYGNALSTLTDIQHGVPQGSILGPLLFLVYINDFYSCLEHGESVMFADDTNVFINHKHINEVYNKAQHELNNITYWLSANRLSLNISKTKYIIFNSNRKKYSRNNTIAVPCINNIPLERVDTMSFLGVILQENLSWKPHILNLLKQIRRNAAVIYKLKHYLNTNNMINIYHCLITSQLRYCITSWNHGNTTLMKKLDQLCNKLQNIF